MKAQLALLFIALSWSRVIGARMGGRALLEDEDEETALDFQENSSLAGESRKKLRLGVFFAGVGDNVMSYEAGGGVWSGYEVEVLKALVLDKLSTYDIEITRVPTLEGRITALQNATVDMVMGVFAVTPARLQQVDFATPYYASSGSALFSTTAALEGIHSWGDLENMTVAMRPGYYAEKMLLAELGVEPLWVESAEEAAQAVKDGEATGVVDNSIISYRRCGLVPVSDLAPMWRVPAGIAVAKGNTELLDVLHVAMMKLVEGGKNAEILHIYDDTFGAAGFPPNPDLLDLVADPYGNTLLNPKSA